MSYHFQIYKVRCSINEKIFWALSLSYALFSFSLFLCCFQMFIRVSSINNDSGILTLRFKCCSTAPCTRRLTQSFYFYVFSDISKCHSTTGKERLCRYRSLGSSSLLRLPARHIPDKHCVAPPAHHLSIFGLKKNRLQHVTLNFH